jgi:hypothetical protein
MASRLLVCDCLGMGHANGGRLDFFLSYAPADQEWAEWIAWTLEADGFKVMLQAWDSPAGSNWIHLMQAGIRDATRTIAVLSPDYLQSVYGGAEWRAAWAQDPDGTGQKLLPVRVSDCDRPGLLAGTVDIDLFGIGEEEARSRLQERIQGAIAGRQKPRLAPAFPGKGHSRRHPPFPGAPAEEGPSEVATVTDLSAFRLRSSRDSTDAPDATQLRDLIAEFSSSAELVTSSYSAGGSEYAWASLESKRQLARIGSQLERVSQWLTRVGMGDDLDTFNLRHSILLYPGAAEAFTRASAALESCRSSLVQRGLLADYEAAWRPLRDLLTRIHQDIEVHGNLPGQLD